MEMQAAQPRYRRLAHPEIARASAAQGLADVSDVDILLCGSGSRAGSSMADPVADGYYRTVKADA